MTINELRTTYNGLIHIKPNNVSEDYIITETDILNERFTKLYKPNSTNFLYNYGLLINDDKTVSVFHTCLNYIEINNPHTEITPKGGVFPLQTNAIISLYKDKKLIKTISQKIHPIYICDKGLISDNKQNIIIPENKEYKDKQYSILCKYSFNGKIFTNNIIILQQGNYNLDFKIHEINNGKLLVSASKTQNISDSGEQILIKSIYVADYTYIQTDFFGTIIDKIITQGVENDVTKNTKFQLNGADITIEDGTIVIPEQSLNAKKRTFTLTATYKNYNTTIYLQQDKGKQKYIKHILEINGEKNFKLNSCLKQTITVPFKSLTQTIINDEIVSESNNNNVLITCNQDWASAYLDNNLLIITVSNNYSNEDRTCQLDITNQFQQPQSITITQPTKQAISCDLTVCFDSVNVLYLNANNVAKIGLKLLKTTMFEDGSILSVDSLLENEGIEVSILNSDTSVNIGTPTLVDFNGNYQIPLSCDTLLPNSSINCDILVKIIDNNSNKMLCCKPKRITLMYDKITYHNIEITVMAKLMSAITNDIFTTITPMLKIMDKATNKLILSYSLQKLWVNNIMHTDKLLQVTTPLIVGKTYQFIIDDINFNQQNYNHIHSEDYTIEADDVGIDIDYII